MNWAVIALAATLLIQAVLSAGMFAAPVLAPAAQADVGVAASAVGLFTALAYGSASMASSFSGGLIARHGPMRVSQVCLLLCAAGTAALASGLLPVILLGAVLLGMAYGPATPASSQILVERTPARMRATILSIKQTGVPLGGAMAGALLPGLILAFGWRSAALVFSLIALAAAIACQPIRRELDGSVARAGESRDPREPLRLMRDHLPLRKLALAGFIFSGVQMTYGSYLVVFLTEHARLSLVRAGFMMSIFMVAGIAGRVVWGAITDRTRRGRLVLAWLGGTSAAAAIVLAFLGSAWPDVAVIALCLVAGASAVGWNGVYLAEVAHAAPEGRVAMATGGSMVACYFGVFSVPILFWLIHAATASYTGAFVVTGVVGFAGVVALLRAGADVRPGPGKAGDGRR